MQVVPCKEDGEGAAGRAGAVKIIRPRRYINPTV